MQETTLEFETTYWIHPRRWVKDKRKQVVVNIPEKWEECSKKQLFGIAHAYMNPKPVDGFAANMLRAFYLLGIKKRQFVMLDEEQIAFFEEQTNWVKDFQDLAIAKPLVKSFGWIFRAPQPLFTNRSILQYALLASFSANYFKKPSRKMARMLVAVSYSPFNLKYNNLSYYSTLFFSRFITNRKLAAMVLTLTAMRNQTAKQFPLQHTNNGDSGPKGSGWSTIIRQVATEGPYGNYKETCKAKAFDFIQHLEDCAEKYRFQKAKRKR